jgi:salicylate hydroxylase
VHIVGGGIAGLAVAAALDPRQFQVRVFEASKAVREKGYGLAIWPSTMKILRDELQIKGLDLRKTRSMAIHRKGTDETFVIEPPHQNPDKGFMKRSSLLRSLLDEVKARHGAHAISTDHKCLRVRLGAAKATATYEHAGSAVSHACDLLVGADGVHSAVRRYVALTLDSRAYGRMTAYRFLVPSPSKELLRKTEKTWNMSISDSIHSPCYHVSNHDDALNVVVLEYDGKPPSRPRPAKLSEVRDVARRSNLGFVIQILDFERISDLMCYSTYHVDCEPWHQPQAVLVGDAAHAYGPLTAKMANLAINDAHSLGMMLNSQRGRRGVAQAQVLREWEEAQRPKFGATRVRTLRHLQLYAPCVRTAVTFLWRLLPGVILEYFGSIFAYDYEVYSSSGRSKSRPACLGLVGVNRADPLVSFLRKWAFRFGTLLILPLALLYHCIMCRTERM